MCPSYFRIKLPKKEAIKRFKTWISLAELEDPVKVDVNKAYEMSVENDQWRGVAVLVTEIDGWTIFHNITGYFNLITTDIWLDFAKNEEFILAAYNDVIEYGKLLVIVDGKIKREFLENKDNPTTNINIGAIEFEREKKITSWVNIEKFIDDDYLGYESDEVILWLFKAPDNW